jgi:hypothetical protein
VPALRGDVVEVAGRPGLVLERLEGSDLLTSLEQRPWRIVAVGRRLGAVHAALHGVEAPAGLRDVRELLYEMLRSPLVPERERDAETTGAIARLLPVGRRLLAALYLRSYRADRPIDRDRVERWWRVGIAARLAEDIEGEREGLLAAAVRTRGQRA